MPSRLGRPARIFLSSRLLGPVSGALRADLRKWDRPPSLDLWLSDDHIGPDLQGSELEERCMLEVRDSDLVIPVENDGYGTPAWLRSARVSLLEIEVLQALLAGRPLAIKVLVPVVDDEQLRALLYFIRRLAPTVVEELHDYAALLESVRQTCLSFTRPHVALKLFLTRLGLVRHRSAVSDPAEGVRFLGGMTPACTADGATMSASALGESISCSDGVGYFGRLAVVWRALRNLHVGAVSGDEIEVLTLTTEALAGWLTAAPWCGLHGHVHLGSVAAAASLIDARAALHRLQGGPGRAAQRDLAYGPLASALYSTAMLVGRTLRRRLLIRADECLDLVLRLPDEHAVKRTEALAIRGSVQLRLGRGRQAVETFERVVKTRRYDGTGPASVAEAECELAYACFLTGSIRRAGRLFQEAIPVLEAANAGGFLIRAKRKQAQFLLATGRIRASMRALQEASALSRLWAAPDQLRGLVRAVHVLESELGLVTPLVARAGPEGVVFLEDDDPGAV